MERYRDLLVDLARPPLTGLFEPPCLSAPELAMVDALMELLVRPCVGYRLATDAASASLWRLAGGRGRTTRVTKAQPRCHELLPHWLTRHVSTFFFPNRRFE